MKSKIYGKTAEARKESSVSRKQRTDFSQSTSSPIDQILSLQRTIGNQAVQRLFKSGVIQAKLKIGQPNDIYEQEANRVAEQVMSMPEPRLQQQPEQEEEKEELIQTKPLAEQITPLVQRQVEPEDEEEEKVLQAKVNRSQAAEVGPDLKSRIQALRGGGQPLPKSVRAFFEPRFRYDFSKVQIHNNHKAVEAAQARNARAFTIGNSIVFGASQYSPHSTEGKKLLAHELTHVMQQSTGQAQSQYAKKIQSLSGQPDVVQCQRRRRRKSKRVRHTTDDVFIEIMMRNPDLAELITPNSLSGGKPPILKGGPVKGGEGHRWIFPIKHERLGGSLSISPEKVTTNA